MFIMFTGNIFHKIAPWYKALFLYFSQLGITVLKSGATLDLVLRTDSSRGGPFLFFADYFQSF